MLCALYSGKSYFRWFCRRTNIRRKAPQRICSVLFVGRMLLHWLIFLIELCPCSCLLPAVASSFCFLLKHSFAFLELCCRQKQVSSQPRRSCTDFTLAYRYFSAVLSTRQVRSCTWLLFLSLIFPDYLKCSHAESSCSSLAAYVHSTSSFAIVYILLIVLPRIFNT